MLDELRAIQLYLHPTRREALSATETALTRWSLETNPATILTQFSTAPKSLFSFSYAPTGEPHYSGGITGSPDGFLFAHEHITLDGCPSSGHPTIEWRNWDDLSVARAVAVPHMCSGVGSLTCSPDGRWLVLESTGYLDHPYDAKYGARYVEQLFLLDWQTGEVLSRHDIGAIAATHLTFDATSTFVAGVLASYDGDSFFKVWRLDPADCFVPQPFVEDWLTHKFVPQDEVSGNIALTTLNGYPVPWNNDWPGPLHGGAGSVMFSPDSSMVILGLNVGASYREGVGGFELVTCQVPSGKVLWSVYNPVASTGEAIFSPDGSVILVPELGGDLLVYRAEDGELVQRLPTGLSQPVQALAFDHDGKTLWLATEEGLVQYQPKG